MSARTTQQNAFDVFNQPIHNSGPPTKSSRKRNKQRAKAAASREEVKVVTIEPVDAVTVPQVTVDEQEDGWNVRKAKGASKAGERSPHIDSFLKSTSHDAADTSCLYQNETSSRAA